MNERSHLKNVHYPGIIDLNVKYEVIKFQKKLGENLSNVWVRDQFYNTAAKTQTMK